MHHAKNIHSAHDAFPTGDRDCSAQSRILIRGFSRDLFDDLGTIRTKYPPVNDGTLLALLQIDKWRMLAPVKHGDTIRMQSTVLAKKLTSKADRGIVTFKRACVKQNGSSVQEMEASLIYRRRPLY